MWIPVQIVSKLFFSIPYPGRIYSQISPVKLVGVFILFLDRVKEHCSWSLASICVTEKYDICCHSSCTPVTLRWDNFFFFAEFIFEINVLLGVAS